MKLRCVYTEVRNPEIDAIFTVGKIYSADAGGDRLYIKDDNGTEWAIDANSLRFSGEDEWSGHFEVAEEHGDNVPKFGDELHIDGDPVLFIKMASKQYYCIDTGGYLFLGDKEDFDEYKPDPTEERAKKLLELWRQRDLMCGSYDTFDTIITVEEMIIWMEENKDAINAILTE